MLARMEPDGRTFDRTTILGNLERIRAGIAAACERSGRDPGAVRIVAAAKTVPPEPIHWVVQAGAIDVGENYVGELSAKHDAVPGARWHFIGTLQSGTAHKVAELAEVVETLSAPRATARLARRAAEGGRRIEALLEIDFTGARSGLAPSDAASAADAAAAASGIELVGLMTLPPFDPDPEHARRYFARLAELAADLRRDHSGLRELSMGMSLDYEVAVEEGATMVRIGTTLFGDRPHRH